MRSSGVILNFSVSRLAARGWSLRSGFVIPVHSGSGCVRQVLHFQQLGRFTGPWPPKQYSNSSQPRKIPPKLNSLC